jgi:signal transduction histidine kinase/ligand-binding sensor domain-containing protein
MGTREAGLFRFPKEKTLPIVHALPGAKINCLLAAGDSNLWIGTDDGLIRWDGSEFTAESHIAFKDTQVLSLAMDRDANLWVGTDSRGLLRLNSHGVARMNESGGPRAEAVTALFEDREGNLWIGSAAGLERLRDSAFVNYSFPKGLAAEGNSPIFVDADNRLWLPPASGGLWWAKDGQEGKIAAAGLDRDVVYSIAGRRGDLWLGRRRGGLTRLRYENGAFTAKSYTQANGLAQNSVFSVYESRDGTVWAGTLSAGVSKLTAAGFTTYTVADGLASNTVSSVLETRDGTTWFATPTGLSALFQGHWRTYTAKDGLPSTNVNCLFEDSHGGLWAGTAAGLAFAASQSFRAAPGGSLSLHEQVLGIAEDTFGWLWISTPSRVLRVKRDKLIGRELADGDIREFGPADGLRGIEGVNRRPSVVTDPLGRIWFSLNRGVSSVDPSRLARNSAPAIVHIQTVLADNLPIPLGASVRIPGGSKRITLGFIGLSLSSPERVRFRYQLESYDRGWSNPSATPEATYTNLSPGTYRFRLIASNPDGIWSKQEASLELRVDAMFWQTWWFFACAVFISILAVVAVYRLRLDQMTKRLNIRFDERLAERTRLARELHDTLLQTIQGSKMLADDGLDDPSNPARVYHALERVSTFLSQASQEGRAALTSLRSFATEHNDLAEAFERAGEDYDFKKSLTFVLTVVGEARDVNPVVRDEVYRIGLEAMRNACLHSRGARLEVELNYRRDLIVHIRDNGIGVDPDLLANGKQGHFGIMGMRERAERIGAQLRWKSTPTGTDVQLTVPGFLAFRGENKQPGLLTRLIRLLTPALPRK